MKEIFLYTGIWDYSAEKFITDLNSIPQDEDVLIRLNSPGGSVFAGWAMALAIQERTGKTIIRVEGNASSMATILILFADEVHALDVAKIMIHRAIGYVSNEDDQKMLDSVNKDLRVKLESKIDAEKLKDIYGVTFDDIFKGESRRNIWLDAKEAKKIKLVDKIIRLETSAFEDLTNKFVAIHDPESQGSGSTPRGSEEGIKAQNKNNNQKPSKMTKEEFKAQNPAAYDSIFNDGVLAGNVTGIATGTTQEKGRVEAYMVFAHIDPEAVKKGIEGTENPTLKFMAEMNLKASSPEHLKKVEAESAAPQNLGAEEKKVLTDEEKEVEAFEKGLDKELDINQKEE